MARNKGLNYQDIRELQDPGWRRAGSKTRPYKDKPFGGEGFEKRVYEPAMKKKMEREDAVINPYSDDSVFDHMVNKTTSGASNLFTESQYNTLSSKKERAVYDKKALDALIGMWQSDRDKNQFKGIDFNRYVELLKPSLFEERVLAREGDQKLGDFFLDIYEGDVDQFKASAMRAPMPGPADE